MIVTVEVGCEGEPKNFDDPCPRLRLYPNMKTDGRMATEADGPVALDDVPRAMAERLRSKGWVTVDEKHFCPRHTPDKVGNVVQLGAEYTSIGEGWEARVSGGANMIIDIEVRRVPESEPPRP